MNLDIIPADFEAFLNLSFLGNSIRDYLVALLLLILGLLLARFTRRFLGLFLLRVTRLTRTKVDDYVAEGAVGPTAGIVFIAFCYLAVLSLDLPEVATRTLNKSLFVAFAFLVGLILSRSLDVFFRNVFTPWARSLAGQPDDQLSIFAWKFSKFTLWILLIFMVMEHVGLDMVSLVTGLGLGGLAVALAAQETVANLLGSFQIMADRPFIVGDWVNVSGRFGQVREIGLRSTKLMTRGRILVILPNKLLAQAEIENWSIGGDLKVDLQIGLVYETTAEQLENAKKIIEEIIEDQEGLGDGHLIHFLSFGDFSLNLQVTYFVKKISHYWDIQHQINLSLKQRFDEAGLSFAFPTRTIHLSRDDS